MVLRMSLKALLLVLATHCLLAAADDDLPSDEEIKRKCQEEHHLTEDDLEMLNSTKNLETSEERIKCFVKCFLVELKVLNEMGDVIQGVKSRNPKIVKQLETCETVNGTDACDKAVNFQNCLWNEMEPDVKLPE